MATSEEASNSAMTLVGATALAVAAARATETMRDDRLFEDLLAGQFVLAGGDQVLDWLSERTRLLRLGTGDLFALRPGSLTISCSTRRALAVPRL